MRTPVAPIAITRVEGGTGTTADDILVTEEPLEIRLGHGPTDDRREFRLSVTMRTPGNDEELALGFLFTEGIISDPSQVVRIVPCENVKEEERGNVVRAELHPSIDLDPLKWQRNFYTTSSCGVCGKSSIDAVRTQCTVPMGRLPALDPAIITALPDRMREAQTVFKHTGGIHAAALFNEKGELLILREDIGRHNAVDKLVGALLTNKALSLRATPKEWAAGRKATEDPRSDNRLLLVSGRAGFELVQKCAMAGIPAMAAVGAPSSLAVQLAKESGLLLIGFLRGERYNIYAHGAAGRIMSFDQQARIEELLHEPITVSAYDPRWPVMYAEEEEFLQGILPRDLLVRIAHIGSTAVPGCSAKPIIDIQVEVRELSEEVRREVVPLMQAHGYEFIWRPSIGEVAPFYAWFIRRNAEGHRTHHIHMVVPDAASADRLIFRDHLRQHHRHVLRYERLKQALSEVYPNDRAAYTKGKSDFIASIVKLVKDQRS